MERKIGEIFKYNGEWYQCIKVDPIINADGIINYCEGCSISASECDNFNCIDDKRSDKELVIFKKLVKLGEPKIINGKKVQLLKSKYCKNCAFWDNNDCTFTTYPRTCMGGEYGVYVEIKQNKEEDMKTVRINKDDLNFIVNKIRYGILPRHTDCDAIIAEITDLFSVEDVNLSNTENIGKNLKPFDLEAAKASKPVCTRDGRKAIFLTTLSNKNFPVVAIVSCGQEENIYQYDINGVCDEHDDNLDLMMLPEKKEGWINIYPNELKIKSYLAIPGNKVYPTKELAEYHALHDCIATVPVEWEE